MEQDLDTEPDGSFGSEWTALSGNDSTILSPGNKVKHVAPTESNQLLTVEQMDIDWFGDGDNNNEEDAVGTGSTTSTTDGAVDDDTTMIQKRPMPAWMTDPSGRIELTGIPSVNNPHMDMEILVHYCTLCHVEYVGLINVKARDQSRTNGESQPLQGLSYQQPNGIATDIAAHAHTGAPNPLRQDGTRSSQAGTAAALRTLETVQPVYVVLIHFQPLVEHAASEFVSLMQDIEEDHYPDAGPLGIIPHYTKVFVDSHDAKTYAMDCFRERTTMDYRYIVQKSWHDMSSEERRKAGVTPLDSYSPDLSKFRFSMSDTPRYWQIRFGCNEEYCRITALPVHPKDPRVEGLELQQRTVGGDGDGVQQDGQDQQSQNTARAAAEKT